jgi:hypothetical protein
MHHMRLVLVAMEITFMSQEWSWKREGGEIENLANGKGAISLDG